MMDHKTALGYVLHLLARREYCAAQLRAKLLQRGATEETADSVIRELSEQGLISDERFAESFLRARQQRGDALWLAVRKAEALGVDARALERVRKRMEHVQSSLEICRRLLAARDPQGLRHEDERIWQRHARFLRSKGHDMASIMQALKEHGEDS
ncbi:MAG: regulatory protein RecX [Zetaproteobacteria bacterium]|nr:MAG: regulatory protein RecX [Zetaproteobacteria bacterium]